MFIWRRRIIQKVIQEKQTYSLKVTFPPLLYKIFPIRGHKVFLHIKRRRWLNITTGKVVYRDWNEVAEGTRMTSEFSAFLKEIGG
ncbi:ISAon1 family transposase N-terminal region protein [Dyadobacter chenwenxiniae]|uniref:ISAon1 family transposase N-terminal region protein n=1 Tax=Dyadobacter chenwenxiniae TaxID=2906456 RepID=UPI00404373CD